MTESVLKSSLTETVEDKQVLTCNDIATKLLNDRFLLTALEFHTELIESGRELKQLKDFFSNPSNFEQHLQTEPSACIPRSGSQATLDSLDLTRFSEDGERGTDERIAVLEFELRKAKETINALRTNLTVATESEISVPEAGTPKHLDNDPVKPHEQRALNFLINEYLLSYEYKLTSITFADENENQDFDDWEDVGLNITRPAKLLTLYRHGLRHSTQHDTRSVACTADLPVIDEAKDQLIVNLQLEIEKLRQELSETEALKLEVENKYEVLKSSVNQISNVVDHDVEKTESHSGSDDKSLTPETFEVIGQMKNEHHRENSVSIEDDHDSPVSFNDTDWTSVTMPTEQVISKIEELQDSTTQDTDLHELISTSSQDQDLHELNLRKLPSKFQKELQRACKLENFFETTNQTSQVTPEFFIDLTGDALPRIVPQMLVGARELAVPLLSACTVLSNSSRQRDSLLAQLFSLKKRPSPEERRAIINGVVSVAAWAGHTITESELLPQCWEQLAHKSTERRLLVAETCSALVPHVSSAMRSSLLMSMLQQLLGDREAVVRESAIVALANLVSRCDDSDKYTQCEQMMLCAVVDVNQQVAAMCRNTLLPVMAQWALHIDKFDTLVKSILKLLDDLMLRNENGNEEEIVQEAGLLAFRTLLPFILVYVADGAPPTQDLEQGLTIDIALTVQQLCSGLNNPSVFYNGDKNIGMVIHEFYKIMEDKHDHWPQLTWFLNTVLPSLLTTIGHINVNCDSVMLSMMDLIYNMCILFGEAFCEKYLRIETGILAEQEKGTAIIAAYIAQLKAETLGDKLGMILCSQSTSLDALRPAVHWTVQHADLREPLLVGLWTGVAQASDPSVRRSSAALFTAVIADLAASREQRLLAQRVAPAAVTLASDPDMSVRYSALPVLSELVRHCGAGPVTDKALLQLRSYLNEPPPGDDVSARELSAAIAVIAPFCEQSYREDILLPALGNLASLAAEQRRPTMASIVLDSYGAILECRLSAHALTGSALPGLRALLTLSDIRTPDFQPESVLALVREAERRASPAASHLTSPQPLTSALQQGMHRMFSSKPAANLQQMFKKK